MTLQGRTTSLPKRSICIKIERLESRLASDMLNYMSTDGRSQWSARQLQLALGAMIGVLTLWYFESRFNNSTSPSTLSKNHSSAVRGNNDWLIATISPALAQRRRNMIRTTWQALYSGPSITTKFILANPGQQWMPLLQHENDTYGDLIMLDYLHESHDLGMQTKELDFLLWLVKEGQEWRYVSKIDDDAYVDATAFYEDFLEPQLQHAWTVAPGQEDPVLIGRHLGRGGTVSQAFQFPYPGGQFYTMSWSLITSLVNQYNTSDTRHAFADVLIGMLLEESGTNFTFVDMPHEMAFELKEGEFDNTQWEHDVIYPAMNPHQLKDDEVFMRVSEKMRQIGIQRSEMMEGEKLTVTKRQRQKPRQLSCSYGVEG